MIFDEADYSTTLVLQRIRELETAREAVRPLDPAVMGMDSVDQIYGAGLRALGTDPRELLRHKNAAKAAFAHARKQPARRPLAMDAKSQQAFDARFPGAKLLKMR